MPYRKYESGSSLLHLVFEALARNKVGDLIIISFLLTLLHVLVALGKLAERCKGVRPKLVEDAGDELGELLVLAIAIDGECVGRNSGMDCANQSVSILPSSNLVHASSNIPLGAAKWMTFPSLLNMFTSSIAWMGWVLSFLRVC